MLKYILLICGVSMCVQCHPLVTEKPSVVPVPIHHSGEDYSSVVPSLISDSIHKIPVSSSHSTSIESNTQDDKMLVRREVSMSPVKNIRDIQDDTQSKNSGGQKRVRQVPEGGPPSEASNGSPPPSEELCSIFQFFLESRRFSRCRVSNTDNERHNDGPPPPRATIELGAHRFDFNSNFHRPVSNDVAPSSDPRNGDNFQSESETREIENESQRSIIHDLPPRMELGNPNRNDEKQQTASKRYDQIDDLTFHGGLEDHFIGPHHPPPPPPGPPPMYPKSSLDRTTIIVPERPCPRGERRDHKGFCRRIVRVSRPNYQYGPPPPPYGPSRPIRYYYSRFVSVPTLQFFIPAVP